MPMMVFDKIVLFIIIYVVASGRASFLIVSGKVFRRSPVTAARLELCGREGVAWIGAKLHQFKERGNGFGDPQWGVGKQPTGQA